MRRRARATVPGGEPLLATPTHDGDGGDTWTYLYTDYFGPAGAGELHGASGDCHGAASELGRADERLRLRRDARTSC